MTIRAAPGTLAPENLLHDFILFLRASRHTFSDEPLLKSLLLLVLVSSTPSPLGDCIGLTHVLKLDGDSSRLENTTKLSTFCSKQYRIW